MKYRFSKRVLLGIAALVLTSIGVLIWANRSNTNNWVDVGIGGPEKFQDFPYRLIDLIGKEPIPPTHSDLVSLTLHLQSGRARGSWIYLPIFECYAPDVLDGVPSVRCNSENGSKLFVGGNDNVREVLLSLRQDGKRGAVRGRVMGLYAGDPVIWVNDPSLKRKTE